MRVLQAIAGTEHGGAERFFERLVPALLRAGVEQRVLMRRHGPRFDLLTKGGLAEVHQLPFGNRLDLTTKIAFRKHVRDFNPDIVFTWMSRASAVAPGSPQGRSRFVRVARLGGYYDLKYYRGADYLVADAQGIVDHAAAEGFPADRAVCLPNFVGDKVGKPISRSEFFIPEGAPILLALGRLHPNKGFDLLLEALAQVPGAYLLLAGSGPGQETLDRLATSLGVKPRLRFLGWRDDAPDLFATADLFIHPARQEPLGNVVIEAWAQGVPVVCTAAQGPQALVEHEISGLLTPVDQAAPLAAAIRRALADRPACAAWAEAGRRIFRQRYTEPAVVAAYCAFFERITA